MTHTPAPWKLSQQEKWPFQLQIDAPDGQKIVEMHRWAYSTEQKDLVDCLEALGFKHNERQKIRDGLQEQIANARLIAAAPELLEALEFTVAHLQGYALDCERDDAITEALAAIAKAKGTLA